MKILSSKFKLILTILLIVIGGTFFYSTADAAWSWGFKQFEAIPTLKEKCKEMPDKSDEENFSAWDHCREEWNALANKNSEDQVAYFSSSSYKIRSAIADGAQALENWAGNLFMKGLAWILYYILLLANFLVGVAGNLFDTAITYSILEMSKYTGILSAITEVWALIRDMFNVSFIFVLLWVSIKTIIGVAGFDTKKMVVNIIIAALLINFSLFITKVIIDTGNMLATDFYKMATKDIPVGKGDTAERVSGGLFQGLGLSTLYEPSTSPSDAQINSAFMIMLSIKIILSLVTFYAFIMAAFMFITRTIAFFILMPLSPLAFMQDTIPYLTEHVKKWWNTLYSQALVAPVFLFFIIIIVKLAQTKSFLADSNGSQVPVSAYFNFALIIGLLIAAVKVTKKLSDSFGTGITGMGSKLLGFGLGMATGGLAIAGRQTIGRGFAALANNEGLKASAAAGGIRGFISNRAIAGSKKVGNATFDARNTKTFGSALKTFNAATGVELDAGKGGKGGYTKRLEEYAQRQSDFAKNNLGRDLTDEQAEKEHTDIVDKQRAETTETAKKLRAIDIQLRDQTMPGDVRQKYQEERRELVKTFEKQRAEAAAHKKQATLAWTRNANGELDMSEEAKKAREKIKKERNQAYQRKFAESEANDPINKLLNRSKGTKKKIEKDVLNGQTGAEELQKLVEKMAKEQREKEAKDAAAAGGSGTSGSTGSTSSGSTRGSGGSTAPSGGSGGSSGSGGSGGASGGGTSTT